MLVFFGASERRDPPSSRASLTHPASPNRFRTLTRIHLNSSTGDSRQPLGARRGGAPGKDRSAVRAAMAAQGEPRHQEGEMDSRGGRAGTHSRLYIHRSSAASGPERRAREFSRDRSRVGAPSDAARDGGAPAARAPPNHSFPLVQP